MLILNDTHKAAFLIRSGVTSLSSGIFTGALSSKLYPGSILLTASSAAVTSSSVFTAFAALCANAVAGSMVMTILK